MAVEHNNLTDVKGDGRIVIYQRPRRDGSIIPTWQMRISVPNSTGYHRQSTGETDKAEASRKALNTYEELYMKVLSGVSLNAKTYKSVFEAWQIDLPRMVSKQRKGRQKYIDDHLRNAGRNALEYFGNKKIDEIKKGDFQEYWMWRKENSTRLEPMTGRRTPFVPADNSLRQEGNSIKQMFNYAVDKGWMVSIPDMAVPPPQDNRRPTFSKQEWRKLTRRMREWVKEGEKWGSVGRDRFVSQQYILLLANCGARVGEMRFLRWQDLSTQTDGEKKDLLSSGDELPSSWLVASIRNSKTIEREIVFQQGSEEYIKRLYDLKKKELGEHPAPDDYVFCDTSGIVIISFRKGFNTLLDQCELTYDEKGNKRSLYSLRHFYATQRLTDEVNPFLLARQMGTSIEMLQKFYGQPVTRLVARQITKTDTDIKPRQQTGNAYPFEVR